MRSGLQTVLSGGFGREARAAFCGIAMMTAALVGGCTKGFLAPHEVGRFDAEPLVVPILETLDIGVEEPDDRFIRATDPLPEDRQVIRRDYVIGRNDLLSIAITDLIAPGVDTVRTARVTETGNISLPWVGEVRALGLTTAELEAAIGEAYRPEFIEDAHVMVTVIEMRNRTFSIFGSVGAPGQYQLIKADFRVLDALVLARGAAATEIDYLYIIRRDEEIEAPERLPDRPDPDDGIPDLEPRSEGRRDTPVRMSAATGSPPSGHVALLQANEQDITDALAPAPETEPVEPVEPGEPADDDEPMAEQEEPEVVEEGIEFQPEPEVEPEVEVEEPEVVVENDEPFEFNDLTPLEDERIIRVPLRELLYGELQHNIVVRPNDMIYVPSPVIGEYYMGGHVVRPGVYSLTGRRITLKQAIISAGMLDGVAIPQRTDVIRRIGRDQEVFVRVNVARIFEGHQSDIFLKPNDQIIVGTDAFAPFLAALRGAFRATYGFGFIYDRNFAVSRGRQQRF